jgi:dissimilatory sulfite reductase (desulfoviridin) alpha/beta subunit
MFTLTISSDSATASKGLADLSEREAWALAQFVKRVGWSEFRELAVDEAEAYEIRSAIDKLQSALAGAGLAPR